MRDHTAYICLIFATVCFQMCLQMACPCVFSDVLLNGLLLRMHRHIGHILMFSLKACLSYGNFRIKSFSFYHQQNVSFLVGSNDEIDKNETSTTHILGPISKSQVLSQKFSLTVYRLLMTCDQRLSKGEMHIFTLLQLLCQVSGRLGDRVRDIREWREELRTEVNN